MMQKDIHQYLASIGSKGGSAKTNAKAQAARANGEKGGRPKKPVFRVKKPKK